MFGRGRLAVRGTLAASLTGLAILAASPAATAVTSARAAPAAPAAAGSFKTWAAAQKAAGFGLYTPKKTASLVRRTQILVTRCHAVSKVTYDVYAIWGDSTFLALDQNNTGAACSNPGAARFLHTYTVKGARYRLSGFCGGKGQPACTSKSAILLITWQKGTHYFVGYSHGEARATLLAFATSVTKL